MGQGAPSAGLGLRWLAALLCMGCPGEDLKHRAGTGAGRGTPLWTWTHSSEEDRSLPLHFQWSGVRLLVSGCDSTGCVWDKERSQGMSRELNDPRKRPRNAGWGPVAISMG